MCHRAKISVPALPCRLGKDPRGCPASSPAWAASPPAVFFILLNSLCASSAVFMNTAIPIAAVLIVSGSFLCLPLFGGLVGGSGDFWSERFPGFGLSVQGLQELGSAGALRTGSRMASLSVYGAGRFSTPHPGRQDLCLPAWKT